MLILEFLISLEKYIERRTKNIGSATTACYSSHADGKFVSEDI